MAATIKQDAIVRIVILLIGLMSLLGGGIIYILFRSRRVIFLSWLDSMGLDKGLDDMRKYIENQCLCDFVLYSLPDGLWMLAYILVIGAMWNFKTVTTTLFVVPMIIFSFVNEILQGLNIIPGTYDMMDMLTYTISIIIGFTIISISIQLTK